MTTGRLGRREWLIGGAAALAWPAHARALQRRREHLFGSPIELLLPEDAPPALGESVLEGLRAMNARWNAWKPGEVSALNAAFRSGRAQRTTPELVQMIRGAARLEHLSQGRFNAGIGGLVGAWGFHDDQLRPGPAPQAGSLRRWTDARPSLQQIEIRGLDVRSTNPALQLDFGGYAKGVAIDWALDRLRAGGVHDALVDLGGNLAAMGGAPGRAWHVGVRDPHGPGLVARLITHGREAVVTSGTYERWRLAGGERVTHLIDPASGRPVSGSTCSSARAVISIR